MTLVDTPPSSAPEDRELAHESFFVAVCDCDEDSFVQGFGCIHPYHVAPSSVLNTGNHDVR
jgi:hypothetical protein